MGASEVSDPCTRVLHLLCRSAVPQIRDGFAAAPKMPAQCQKLNRAFTDNQVAGVILASLARSSRRNGFDD